MTHIRVSGKDVVLHVDTNGNVYLEYNRLLYQLNIITCERGEVPVLERGEYSEIIYSEEGISKEPLHIGRIKASANYVDDKYFPEDSGISLIGNDTEDEDDVYEQEEYFKFYGSLLTPIVDRDNGHVVAMYDMFLYDSNGLVFRTKLCGKTCVLLYRVILHTDGQFYFRPIGCQIEKKYELIIKDDIIMII